MGKLIQARLDEETEKLLKKLQSSFDGNTSHIVREALKVLAAITPSRGARSIVGVGKFESGIKDLGSNKKHLKGFGK